jgi:FkbM family methyltransferase
MNFLKKIYYSKYTKKSYAISNVDLIIDRIFKKRKKGLYIDVGCNHPIKFNNTYLLYKRGWNGINIDSDNKSINEFQKLRKDDHNVRSLVSNSKKKINYYFYHDRSALNTVDKKLVNSRKKKPTKIIKMETSTLENILKESPFNDKKINLLSIDIENHEYEVLKKFNFKKYKIDMIVTECLNLKAKKLETQNQSLQSILKSKIYKLLKKNNYSLINWVNSDLVFIYKNSKI